MITLRGLMALLAVTVLSLATGCGGSEPAPTATTAPTPSPTNAPTLPPTSAPPSATPVVESPTAAAVATVEQINPTPAEPVGGTPFDLATASAPPTDNENLATPTHVTAVSTGEKVTALQALGPLRERALKWHDDAMLALLADVRPGQAKNVLGSALGDPDVNEPTPDGKAANWTMIAVSPKAKAAEAFSLDGSEIDLVKQGSVTAEFFSGFSGGGADALRLSTLDTSKLVDSDKILAKGAAKGPADKLGVALLAPDALGAGPLPTPQSGGASPHLAYELYSTDPNKQVFMFADAASGEVVLDSSTP